MMLQFQAWFPGAETPVPVQTLAVSDSFDLAVLQTDRTPSSAGLPIADGYEVAESPGNTGFFAEKLCVSDGSWV